MRKIAYYIIPVLIFLVGCGLWKTQYPFQDKGDIIFSHKKHIEMDVECDMCHTQNAESELASDNNYPEEKDCLECHEREECSLCHTNVKNAIHLVPRPTGLIFPHKAHLESNEENLKETRRNRAESLNRITPFVKHGSLEEKIDCITCHSSIRNSTQVADKFPPDMGTCRKCHEITEQSCDLCHSDLGEKDFIPASHYIGWLQRHKLMASAGDGELCQNCHRGEIRASRNVVFAVTEDHVKNEDTKACADCHRGDIWPEAVHDNNRIQSHGIDAKVNENVCNSCHQRKECLFCHEQRGLTFSNIHPVGWQFNHADKARRQLSSCVACHKEEDCLGCHQTISPHPSNWKRDITERNKQVCSKCHI